MLLRPKQILHAPGIPPTIGLTDRDTGTVYYLKVDPAYTDSAGNVRLALVDTIGRADKIGAQVYVAYDGPMLGRGVRLLVRGGRLGYEVLPGYNVMSAPVIARAVNSDLVWYKLALPTTVEFDGDVPPRDHLAYTLQPFS